MSITNELHTIVFTPRLLCLAWIIVLCVGHIQTAPNEAGCACRTSTLSSTASTLTNTSTSTSSSTSTRKTTTAPTKTSTPTSTSTSTSSSSRGTFAQTSAACKSLLNGLIDYWSFDNTFLDSVTSMMLSKNCSNVVGFAKDRNGKPSGCVHLSNGYLRLPSAVYFTGDYSTALWMYAECNGNLQSVYLIQSELFVNFFGLFVDSNGLLQVKLGTSKATVNFFYNAITTLSNSNKWIHVGVTLQGTLLSCYINGHLASSMTLAYPRINAVTRSQSYFGSPQYPFKGYLDEVFFYNRALSATEMSSILTFNYKKGFKNFI